MINHLVPPDNSWFRSTEKWLLWETPPWPSSVWISARHWPAMAWPSSFPSTLALPSLSPWTPWRMPWPWTPRAGWRRRRSWVPPPSGEMPGARKSFWGRSKSLALRLLPSNLSLHQQKKKELANRWRIRSSVTNVTTLTNLKMVWRFTLENHTRMWTQPHHHPIAYGRSQAVRRPCLLPPSGMSPGRKSGRRMGSRSLPSNHPGYAQTVMNHSVITVHWCCARDITLCPDCCTKLCLWQVVFVQPKSGIEDVACTMMYEIIWNIYIYKRLPWICQSSCGYFSNWLFYLYPALQ